jgi:hypothetical protein
MILLKICLRLMHSQWKATQNVPRLRTCSEFVIHGYLVKPKPQFGIEKLVLESLVLESWYLFNTNSNILTPGTRPIN